MLLWVCFLFFSLSCFPGCKITWLQIVCVKAANSGRGSLSDVFSLWAERTTSQNIPHRRPLSAALSLAAHTSHTLACILERPGTSSRPLWKASRGGSCWDIHGLFVMLVIIPPDVNILERENDRHKHPVCLPRGLEEWSCWQPGAFKSADLPLGCLTLTVQHTFRLPRGLLPFLTFTAPPRPLSLTECFRHVDASLGSSIPLRVCL